MASGLQFKKIKSRAGNGMPMEIWICPQCGGEAGMMLVSKRYPNIPDWQPDKCRHCGWHPLKYKTTTGGPYPW